MKCTHKIEQSLTKKNCNEEEQRNQEDSDKDCEYKAGSDSNEITFITLYRLLIRIRGR